MAHGISGIEHIALAVSDLDHTVAYLERLGFTVAPGERAAKTVKAGATSLILPRERIEIRRADRDRESRIEAGLLSADLDQCRSMLERKGWTLSEEKRPVFSAGTETEARRCLLLNDEAPHADVNFEICTPVVLPSEQMAEWSTHANGARALGVVTAVNDDPEALCPWAEKLFGESAVVLTDDTLAVFPGHSGFLFVTPDHLGVMFPEFELEDIPAGHVVAISVLVDDIEQTAETLEKGEVDFRWGRADGVLHVPHTPDLNLLLEFTTRDRYGSVRSFFD